LIIGFILMTIGCATSPKMTVATTQNNSVSQLSTEVLKKRSNKTDPTINALAVMQTGFVSQQNKNWQDAVYYYTKALNDIAQNSTRKYGEDNVLSNQDADYTKLISSYEENIEVYKYFIYLNRGRSYMKQNDYNNAARDFRQAIKSNPKRPEAYNYLGVVYTRLGEYDKAIQILKKITDNKSFNGYYKAFNNLGIAYYYTQQLEKAKIAFEYAGKYGYENEDYFNNLGFIYYLENNQKKALTLQKKALEINPIDPNTYINRANAYLKSKDSTQACYNLKIADALDSTKITQARELLALLKGNGKCF